MRRHHTKEYKWLDINRREFHIGREVAWVGFNKYLECYSYNSCSDSSLLGTIKEINKKQGKIVVSLCGSDADMLKIFLDDENNFTKIEYENKIYYGNGIDDEMMVKIRQIQYKLMGWGKYSGMKRKIEG